MVHIGSECPMLWRSKNQYSRVWFYKFQTTPAFFHPNHLFWMLRSSTGPKCQYVILLRCLKKLHCRWLAPSAAQCRREPLMVQVLKNVTGSWCPMPPNVPTAPDLAPEMFPALFKSSNHKVSLNHKVLISEKANLWEFGSSCKYHQLPLDEIVWMSTISGGW